MSSLSPPGADSKSIRLLLIEDDPVDVRVLRERLLGEIGSHFEIENCDRLDSAFERLRMRRFDVVLLDLSLPDSDGSATIARLHRAVPDVPIIALTGSDNEEVIESAIRQGAEDYLIKGSVKTDILVRSIGYAIDRKRLRAGLTMERDSALEAARLRTEFLANMSHEIRTPLTGVVGMTWLLIDTELNDDQREMIEIAQQSSKTLLRIVDDILDFSKISAGKMSLEDADFDLSQAVESVMAVFIEAARTKGVALDSMIESDVPVRLRGDSGRLCQILTNLVGNAVKFTAQGAVRLRVGLVSEADRESVLRFQVFDSGIGIPLDGQRVIFKSFVQAEASTTRRFGGTGLGLAISTQLVELMGGRIGVESVPGDGSTFWFTARFRHRENAQYDTAAANLQLERIRVLICGGPSSVGSLSDHLEAWKIRSTLVTNSFQALAALNDAVAAGDPFEMVIVELGLPASDGFELARAIKETSPLGPVKVIGIHPFGTRPGTELMKTAGIRALLAEPIRPSRLFDTLIALTTPASSVPPSAEPSVNEHLGRSLKTPIPAEIRARKRILLAEDNLVNQQVATRMIERLGYKLDIVGNGGDAIEKLAGKDYDLILMDCQMPELDGYSATQEIRRRESPSRHTWIIGLTAYALSGDRENCLRAGMDDYLSKPVMLEDLAATLDKWLDARAPIPISGLLAEAPLSDTNLVAHPAEAPVDASVLAELREYQKPGEPDFVTELIGIFIDDLADRLTQIRSGLQAADPSRINQAAHALKGASAELGARRMQEICSRLELKAATGSIEDTPSLLLELEAEAESVRTALASHCVSAQALRPAPEV
jgi:two-component system, sensor histidine kinase and response regulator